MRLIAVLISFSIMIFLVFMWLRLNPFTSSNQSGSSNIEKVEQELQQSLDTVDTYKQTIKQDEEDVLNQIQGL